MALTQISATMAAKEYRLSPEEIHSLTSARTVP